MTKRITINKLAEMVAGGLQELRTEMLEGFRSVYVRLDAHDRRFDAIEGQLSNHSSQLDRVIERMLDDTIARVADLSVRLERLEKSQH